MLGEPNSLYVESRSALLDVLEALGEHAQRVVLVGAQAIYLQTDERPFAIAPFTKDADLALIPPLRTEPALEAAMRAARLEPRNNEPGIWVRDGAQVDLLVPAGLSEPEGRRGARLPGHSPTAARKVIGLEGAAVDFDMRRIDALSEGDDRWATIRVAGPAALLVAKVHKLSERKPSPELNKDAYDIYRLLFAIETDVLTHRMRRLRGDERTADVTDAALAELERMFGTPNSPGSLMAGAAVERIGNPANVAASASALATELLSALG